MRKLAIMAALATTALATPAVARDHSWYVGVDAGAMIVEDTKLDFSNDLGADVNDAIILNYKLGYDIGLNGGYDFGGFRLEGELAYKHAGIDEATTHYASPRGCPPEYEIADTSRRVVRFMLSTMSRHHEWAAIRR